MALLRLQFGHDLEALDVQEIADLVDGEHDEVRVRQGDHAEVGDGDGVGREQVLAEAKQDGARSTDTHSAEPE